MDVSWQKDAKAAAFKLIADAVYYLAAFAARNKLDLNKIVPMGGKINRHRIVADTKRRISVEAVLKL